MGELHRAESQENMTKYDKYLKEDAFKLFSLGRPMERIAKEVGISRTTLYDWKRTENWENRNNKLRANAIKEVNETLTDIKKRQHRIIKGVISRFVEQLKNKEVDVKASDIINTLKHELHLLGESETTTGFKLEPLDPEILTKRIKELLLDDENNNKSIEADIKKGKVRGRTKETT